MRVYENYYGFDSNPQNAKWSVACGSSIFYMDDLQYLSQLVAYTNCETLTIKRMKPNPTLTELMDKLPDNFIEVNCDGMLYFATSYKFPNQCDTPLEEV